MIAKIDENLIKKVIYRSNHRGCKETDILLGKYSLDKIYAFSVEEFELFQVFLDEDDLDIYNWLIGKFETPKQYATLVDDILAFTNAAYDH
ncbi:MAG: succinate dehydrogenase assembly factor 2 [Rickettsiales bacterium]|jgi:antitoxin CptB|nr:succinate dehydrogenase assembly factor 2 [Rickettsiales bacterium]